MADFTEAIDILKDEADRNRAVGEVYRGEGADTAAESWTKDARNLDRATAVLEAAGKVSAEDWSTLISWIPFRTSGLIRLKALRDAVEAE